jgi:hypothetical protein
MLGIARVQVRMPLELMRARVTYVARPSALLESRGPVCNSSHVTLYVTRIS